MPNEVQISKSLTVIGSGMDATVLYTDYVSTNRGEIYTLLGSHLPAMVRPGTRMEIRDLAIDCAGPTNDTPLFRQQGLQAVAEEVYLSRIRVRGCIANGSGVEAFGIGAHGRRVWVRDCVVENDRRAYLTGIMVGGGRGWGGTESVVVSGCFVDGYGYHPSIGLGAAHARNLTVTGNVFRNVSRGMMCDTGGITNLVAAGNILKGAGGFGLYLAYFSAENVRLTGNVFEDFQYAVFASRNSAGYRNREQRIGGLSYRDNSFVNCKGAYRRE